VTDDSILREAIVVRLHAKQALLRDVAGFLAVNAVLWFVWALGGHERGLPWPVWVTGLWAIGILGHAWRTFLQQPVTERELQRELRRRRRR
jgi:hypothetical protein